MTASSALVSSRKGCALAGAGGIVSVSACFVLEDDLREWAIDGARLRDGSELEEQVWPPL